MELLVYALILAMLLLSYYFAKQKNTKREFVQCVEAGPVEGIDSNDLAQRSYFDRQIVIRDERGQELNHDNYSRLIVKGACMTERKIYDGDTIIAEIIDNSRRDYIKKELQPDNIVWLHIEDTGMDKIRVFQEWKGDDMITYYYKNGVKHPSSSNHNIEQIRGIVRYKI